MRISAKKRLRWRILVAIIMLSVGGFWLWYRFAFQPPKLQLSPLPEIKPITLEPLPAVMVKLPGATPIVAIEEDYNDNASLWRVVNKDYPLNTPESYVPELAPATLPSASGHRLRPDATEAAAAMFAAAKADGYNLIVGSGYRSYQTQVGLFNSYAARYGEAQANTFSARAGQSEHQTGLAFDVARADKRCFIDDCFGDLPEATWVAEHATAYGFVVRYPKDKTDITKYQYEPWHLRYVGKDLAGALKQSGLTLDEARPYLQTARQQLEAKKSHT